MSTRGGRSLHTSTPEHDGSDEDSKLDTLPPSDRKTPAATRSPEDQVPTPTEFAFIHHAENAAQGKSDADDLSTIRSHAMRNVRRERRLRDEESRQSPPAPQDRITTSAPLTSSEAQLIQRDSHEPPHTDYSPETTSRISRYATSSDLSNLLRYTTPSQSSIEIAEDITLRSSGGIVLDQLVPGFTQYLKYFIKTFSGSLDPRNAHVPVSFAQIAIIEGDAALLHTICYAAAAHKALVGGIDIHTDWSELDEADRSVLESFVQHKDKALSLLKNGLSDIFQACTDTSILTVSLFLVAESFFGDECGIAVHVKGLGQMVLQRGGREAIPHEIYHYVVMADVKTSVLTLSAPSLSLTRRMFDLYFEAESQFLSRQSSTSTGTVFSFLLPPLSPLLSQDMIRCFRVLCYLVETIESSFQSSMASPSLRTHFLVLEHQLLCLSVENAISACYRLALILYCNIALWSWPKASALIKNLLDHLRQASNSCGSDLREQAHSDMLIWCLLLGSFASMDDEIQNFFLDRLQEILSRRNFKNLSQVRSTLPGYFYIDRTFENQLRSLNTKLKLVDDLAQQTVSQ